MLIFKTSPITGKTVSREIDVERRDLERWEAGPDSRECSFDSSLFFIKLLSSLVSHAQFSIFFISTLAELATNL